MGGNPAYVISACVLVIAADKVLAIVAPRVRSGNIKRDAVGEFTNFTLPVALFILIWRS
jgi:hypothetical protein